MHVCWKHLLYTQYRPAWYFPTVFPRLSAENPADNETYSAGYPPSGKGNRDRNCGRGKDCWEKPVVKSDGLTSYSLHKILN